MTLEEPLSRISNDLEEDQLYSEKSSFALYASLIDTSATSSQQKGLNALEAAML